MEKLNKQLVEQFKIRVGEALDTVVLQRTTKSNIFGRDSEQIWLEVVLPNRDFNINVRAWKITDGDSAARIEKYVIAAARALP